MKRAPGTIGIGLIMLLLTGGLSCRFVMPERNIDYNSGRVPVNLPREVKYSETDYKIDKEDAAIVSLANRDQIYVGKERTVTPKNELGDKLNQLLEKQTGPDKMIYVAANVQSDYGSIVEICDAIRKQKVARIGLLVNKQGSNFPSRLAVDLPAPPDLNEDLSKLKPNPLTLVVSISADLKVRLNAEDSGAVNDTAPLSEWLQRILQQRKEQHVYKIGFEMRTDLPEGERIEKTLIIKANRSIKYGDLIKVIDAATGASANPIVLQIDDLRD